MATFPLDPRLALGGGALTALVLGVTMPPPQMRQFEGQSWRDIYARGYSGTDSYRFVDRGPIEVIPAPTRIGALEIYDPSSGAMMLAAGGYAIPKSSVMGGEEIPAPPAPMIPQPIAPADPIPAPLTPQPDVGPSTTAEQPTTAEVAAPDAAPQG